MVGLLVGLGNIGPSYENTRHNIGFDVLDSLAHHLGLTFHHQDKFLCDMTHYKTQRSSFYLIKPTTFMNLSGESVFKLMRYYKSDCIFVVHDDLDLPLGTLRMKRGGSSGGHNGLKSIDLLCGSDYYRLRLGIGRSDRASVIHHVLGKFAPEEMEAKEQMLELASRAMLDYMQQEDFNILQNRHTYNPSKNSTEANSKHEKI